VTVALVESDSAVSDDEQSIDVAVASGGDLAVEAIEDPGVESD
jgi:hypothetical protein